MYVYRWCTKHPNLLEFQYLLIPINMTCPNHWVLLVVELNNQQCTFSYYDSCCLSSGETEINCVRRFLLEYAMSKGKDEPIESETTH